MKAAHAGAAAPITETTIAGAPLAAAVPHTPTVVGPPTPIPPGTGTPAPPAAYPAYGYVTPPPAPPQRSGNPVALLLLGLVALAGIAVGALAAAGVFAHKQPSQTITRLSTLGATPTSRTTPINTTASTAARPPSTASAGSVPSGATSCGGDLSVGPNTSCGFATNVEQAYNQTAGGSQVVTASSPATGLTYTIDCTGGVEHVCTGGTTRDASIYFTSGAPGSSTPAPRSASPSARAAGLHACDQNVFAGGQTSCPFAENVFYEYTQSPQTSSGQVMTIYSPVTHQDYPVTCTPDQQGTVDCYSGATSYTTFSQQAVAAYTPTEAAAYAATSDLGTSNPNG
jgi:hypothetical protein